MSSTLGSSAVGVVDSDDSAEASRVGDGRDVAVML